MKVKLIAILSVLGIAITKGGHGTKSVVIILVMLMAIVARFRRAAGLAPGQAYGCAVPITDHVGAMYMTVPALAVIVERV